MQSRAFNPTPWLGAFNLNHAIEVSGVQRTLYLSGQTATTADGVAMHPGDIVAQFQAAWDNVKDALAAAGMEPSNVIRLNMYTTDVDAFMAAAREGDFDRLLALRTQATETYKLTGTPGFIINGVVQENAYTWADLEPKLQAAIK